MRWQRGYADHTAPAPQMSFRRALADLAQERLTAIIDAVPQDDNIGDVLEEVLWEHILFGLRGLARELLGQTPVEARGEATNPENVFSEVQSLSVAPININGARNGPQDGRGRAFSTYAGPHHLAALLAPAAEQLRHRSVAGIAPPPGVPPEPWGEYVRKLARKRPYLWDNHLRAIEQGYLAPGTSAVVTFPTGAGKPTLSELKIAATLASGNHVLFLAPTRALVGQVTRSLQRAFSTYQVTESLVSDGAYAEVDALEPPDIVVMTPERCLTKLADAPGWFRDLGLLAFDEVHLVHPRRHIPERRSIDAMLCLLGVMEASPNCDFLLMSAMVSNAQDLADWISSTTGRPCPALDFQWKPTRQARGCVVYRQTRVRELMTELQAARNAKTTKGPPAALRRSLTAVPYGLFGLTHHWNTLLSRENYGLVQLLDSEVTLDANTGWELTANKNSVGSAVAARLASSGIKTIVFVQNKTHCESVADQVQRLMPGSRSTLRSQRTLGSRPVMTAQEREWFDSAAADLGGDEFVCGPSRTNAAVHHGLLLPAERRLSESLFARKDGVDVLVATPTLAQGMNLPAEAVIIAGEQRFDPDLNAQELLAAHELLNAAGRAGRAGHTASGIVLVVPGQVVGVTDDLTRATGPWHELREHVFSKPDQCLDLADPVGHLLDRVQAAAAFSIRNLRYFLARLPVEETETDQDDPARRLLRRSFSAFLAERKGVSESYHARLEAGLRLRRELLAMPEKALWLDRVASTLGLPHGRVREIDAGLRRDPLPSDPTTAECVAWLFRWFKRDLKRLGDLLSEDNIRVALKGSEQAHFDRVGPDQVVTASLLARLEEHLGLWMRGKPLREIEAELEDRRASMIPCQRAREFADGFTLGISYVAGAVAQVRRGQIDRGEVSGDMPLSLATLATCIREGVDSAEKLALRYEEGPFASRVQCHRKFAQIDSLVAPSVQAEPFSATRARVRLALELMKNNSEPST